MGKTRTACILVFAGLLWATGCERPGAESSGEPLANQVPAREQRADPELSASHDRATTDPETERPGGAAQLAATPQWASDMVEQGLISKEQTEAAESLGIPVGTKLVLVNEVAMRFVLIPAGAFMMGREPFYEGDPASPRHRVRITKPYYLGIYEVTNEEWEAIMGPSSPQERCDAWGGSDYIHIYFGPKAPIRGISWQEAREFCKRVGKKTGEAVRLPTEAEWEYACRAGLEKEDFFGEGTEDEYIWYMENSATEEFPFNHPHPVGQKKPNPWGLYDMLGNVSEWCLDEYEKDYYKRSSVDDPLRVFTPSLDLGRGRQGNLLATRGGSIKYPVQISRCCHRGCYRMKGFPILGFRVCFNPAVNEPNKKVMPSEQ